MAMSFGWDGQTSAILQQVDNSVGLVMPDRLQYETGDIILRLSNDKEAILLLHSKALSSTSDYFRALFSGRWEQPTQLRLSNGKERSFFELQLQYDPILQMAVLVPTRKASESQAGDSDGAYTSDEDDDKQEPSQPADPLVANGWGEPVRPAFPDPHQLRTPEFDRFYRPCPARRYDGTKVMEYSEKLHRYLFCALYGLEHSFFGVSAQERATFVADVYFLADYYCMKDVIIEDISVGFGRYEWYGEALAACPWLWLHLADDMQHTPLLIEAMKHYAGQMYCRQHFNFGEETIPDRQKPLAAFGDYILRDELSKLHESVRGRMVFSKQDAEVDPDYHYDHLSDTTDLDKSDLDHPPSLHNLPHRFSGELKRLSGRTALVIKQYAAHLVPERCRAPPQEVVTAAARCIVREWVDYFLWDPTRSTDLEFWARPMPVHVELYNDFYRAAWAGDITLFINSTLVKDLGAPVPDSEPLRKALNAVIADFAVCFYQSPLYRFCDHKWRRSDEPLLEFSQWRIKTADSSAIDNAIAGEERTSRCQSHCLHSCQDSEAQQVFRAQIPPKGVFTFLPVGEHKTEQLVADYDRHGRYVGIDFAHYSWPGRDYSHSKPWGWRPDAEDLVIASEETKELVNAIVDGTAEFVST